MSNDNVATSASASAGAPVFTQPASPALPAKYDPVFTQQTDGWYMNTTIDDFSPLISFSDGWITHRAWERENGNPPPSNVDYIPFGLDRFLGTYHYTVEQNATATIEFLGSEIRLYGDGGPNYGAYSLALDGGEPTIHTQHSLAQPIGPDIRMHVLTNLTEGRHTLVITALGSRDGLVEGQAALLDYAVVTQKVSNSTEGSPPQKLDINAESLSRLTTNGTWTLSAVPDDVPPLEGGAKPEIYLERKAFWTNENWATLTHTFQGSAIQAFGGWNASHGAYRATLSPTSNPSAIIHSRIYNETAGCDLVPDDPDPEKRCKWKGSTLKYSVANLDPSVQYSLTLQNLHQGEGRVFEVDLIRVVGSSAQQPGSDNLEGDVGAGHIHGLNVWMNAYLLLVSFFAVRKLLRF